jgi:hypothetical protein
MSVASGPAVRSALDAIEAHVKDMIIMYGTAPVEPPNASGMSVAFSGMHLRLRPTDPIAVGMVYAHEQFRRELGWISVDQNELGTERTEIGLGLCYSPLATELYVLVRLMATTSHASSNRCLLDVLESKMARSHHIEKFPKTSTLQPGTTRAAVARRLTLTEVVIWPILEDMCSANIAVFEAAPNRLRPDNDLGAATSLYYLASVMALCRLKFGRRCRLDVADLEHGGAHYDLETKQLRALLASSFESVDPTGVHFLQKLVSVMGIPAKRQMEANLDNQSGSIPNSKMSAVEAAAVVTIMIELTNASVIPLGPFQMLFGQMNEKPVIGHLTRDLRNKAFTSRTLRYILRDVCHLQGVYTAHEGNVTRVKDSTDYELVSYTDRVQIAKAARRHKIPPPRTNPMKSGMFSPASQNVVDGLAQTPVHEEDVLDVLSQVYDTEFPGLSVDCPLELLGHNSDQLFIKLKSYEPLHVRGATLGLPVSKLSFIPSSLVLDQVEDIYALRMILFPPIIGILGSLDAVLFGSGAAMLLNRQILNVHALDYDLLYGLSTRDIDMGLRKLCDAEDNYDQRECTMLNVASSCILNSYRAIQDARIREVSNDRSDMTANVFTFRDGNPCFYAVRYGDQATTLSPSPYNGGWLVHTLKALTSKTMTAALTSSVKFSLPSSNDEKVRFNDARQVLTDMVTTNVYEQATNRPFSQSIATVVGELIPFLLRSTKDTTLSELMAQCTTSLSEHLANDVVMCWRGHLHLMFKVQNAPRDSIRVADVVNVAIAEGESVQATREVMGWIERQGLDASVNLYIIQAVQKAINISMKSVAPTDKDTTTVSLFDGLSITHQSVDQFSLYQTALITSLAGSPELREKWKTQIIAVAPLSTGPDDAPR